MNITGYEDVDDDDVDVADDARICIYPMDQLTKAGPTPLLSD